MISAGDLAARLETLIPIGHGPLGTTRLAWSEEDAAAGEWFRKQAEAWKRDYGIDADSVPGAGAAGGIGAALAICLGARMHAGIDAVLKAVRFPECVRECDLVITGEGKADRQTLTGKVPFGVLQATRRLAPGIPVVLVAGKVEDREELTAAGFDAVIQVTPEGSLKNNCLDKSIARENIRRAIQDLPYFRD